MYYEQPTKKTYYRFPSIRSVNDFDSKHYYPEKTYALGEDTRFEAKSTNRVQNRETFSNL